MHTDLEEMKKRDKKILDERESVDTKVLEYLERAGKINEKFTSEGYLPTEEEVISMWSSQVEIAKMIQIEEKSCQ